MALLDTLSGATPLTTGTGTLTITDPIQITQSGTYCLTQDIIASGTDCDGIDITASDVTLDLSTTPLVG